MKPTVRGWGLATEDAILVVEDNDGDARLIELMLTEAFGLNITVARARSQAEARNFCAWNVATCVLLDLGLPDADGVDNVKRIASWAPGAAIVVLTGEDDADTGMAAVQAGAQDYLIKGRTSAEMVGRAVRYALVRKRAEQTLAQAQQIAQLGSWELDLTTSQMLWSEELYRLFGFDREQAAHAGALVSRVHPEDRDIVGAAITSAGRSLAPFSLNHRVLLPDGTIRWLRAQGNFERIGSQPPALVRGTAQDITDQRLAEEALAHQALHDPLTGLPNRALLVDRLTQALARLPRERSTLGVIFLDIDGFKVVNDDRGHPAGDQLLLALGRRLSALLRPGDTLARFGGDEFVILCQGLTGASEAIGVAERIRVAMTEPLRSGAGDLVVSVSAGIALATSGSTSPEALLRDSDAAMYRAKELGRGRAEVFVPAMRRTAFGRLDTEVALRQSIDAGDLRVHYQPIVRLTDGRIMGAEALVRWKHPNRGLIGPEEFIPVAEETGLIVPLGGWVLTEACKEATRFQARDNGWAGLTMSVNLSGGQINQPGVVDLVRRALADSGLDPLRLQLEITESVLMTDAVGAVSMLEELKLLGVRLSIDDFGIGYSSLSYLKRFPVDVLKLDHSFVMGLGRDPHDSAIIAAVINLAGALRLDVIAEGVESDVQRRTLIGLGCVRGQGYHFSRPVTAAHFEALLDAQTAGRSWSQSAPTAVR